LAVTRNPPQHPEQDGTTLSLIHPARDLLNRSYLHHILIVQRAFNRRPLVKRIALPDPRDFHTPQPSYTREDLLKSSEGGYFGPGNAQLPPQRYFARK